MQVVSHNADFGFGCAYYCRYHIIDLHLSPPLAPVQALFPASPDNDSNKKKNSSSKNNHWRSDAICIYSQPRVAHCISSTYHHNNICMIRLTRGWPGSILR